MMIRVTKTENPGTTCYFRIRKLDIINSFEILLHSFYGPIRNFRLNRAEV
jgi:hypothetical protein